MDRPAVGVASLAVSAGVLATRGAAVEGLDGANFVHGLSHYDLTLHMPHFPGYPVYVALARVFDALLGDPVLALQLPGALAWSAALVLFFEALCRHHGRHVAWLAWGLCALSPLCWLSAGRTGSDALGLALLTAAASAVALGGDRRWAMLGGLLGGLTLGVRLSYAPAVAGLLVVAGSRTTRGAALGGFAAGMALWFAPFAAVVGIDGLAAGPGFVAGHFHHWGGTPFATETPAWPSRIALFGKHLLVYGLGFPLGAATPLRWAVAVGTVAAACFAVPRVPRKTALFLACVGIPYGIWLAVGQNPDKPRHLLPLLPGLAAVLAFGLARWPPRVVAGFFACLAVVTAQIAVTHHRVPGAPVQLAQWLDATQAPDQVQLFTGQSERVVGLLTPGFRAEYVADTAERDRRLQVIGTRPPRLLWTDEIPGADAPPPGYGPVTSLARFTRDPLVDPHRPEIRVYTAEPLEEVPMSRSLQKSVRVNAPIEAVWAAWTTREGIVTFFAPDARVELHEGGAYEIYFQDGPEGSRGSEGCVVRDLQAPTALAFSWNFPPTIPAIRLERTEVQLTLRADGEQTEVSLVQTGWREGDDWDAGYAYFDRAWGVVMQRLKARFDTGPFDWEG